MSTFQLLLTCIPKHVRSSAHLLALFVLCLSRACGLVLPPAARSVDGSDSEVAAWDRLPLVPATDDDEDQLMQCSDDEEEELNVPQVRVITDST